MGKNKPSKLVLNRETVRSLTSEDLELVAGAKKVSAGDGQVCLTADERTC